MVAAERDSPGNIYSIMTHLTIQPVIPILLYWLSCKIGHILYTLLGLSPFDTIPDQETGVTIYIPTFSLLYF